MPTANDEATPRAPARRAAPPKGWRGVIAWVAPFVLAGLAFNVHASLHIPRKLPLPHPAKTKKKKATQPAKTPAKRNKTTQPTNKAAVKPTPRSARRLDALWRRYGDKPYAREPLDSSFETGHRAIVQRLATQVRQDTFHGAPSNHQLTVVSSSCRTIRCMLIVHAQHRYEIELFADSLFALKRGDAPLLRAVEGRFEEAETRSSDSSSDEPPPLAAHFTIAFTHDLPKLDDSVKGYVDPTPLDNAGDN